MIVPKGPSCQMWNASLSTLVRRSRSRCALVRSICKFLGFVGQG